MVFLVMLTHKGIEEERGEQERRSLVWCRDRFRGRGGGSGGSRGLMVRVCYRAGQRALFLHWVTLEGEAEIAMSRGKCGQELV